jgi:hypothetical protein
VIRLPRLRDPGGLRPRRGALSVLAVTVAALAATTIATASPAAAIGRVSATGGGFDTCLDPSTSALNAWYSPSPYWWFGLYIGGESMGCAQSNLSASYISTNSAHWGFAPIWVGPQHGSGDGCGTRNYSSYLGTDSRLASQAGTADADSAVSKASSLGFGAGSIIYADFEGFNTSSSACVASFMNYFNGFDNELAAKGYQSGAYGSTCGSDLTALTGIGHIPNAIWGADANGDSRVSDMQCVSSTYWSQHQRLKQYSGGHKETYGGVTINIDSDCAIGPVDSTHGIDDTTDGC